jgi:transcriptional regulator with XRE-family HTH domain
MSDLLQHAVPLPTLIAALLVFGFAPGALLRLFLLGYRRGDPRRAELSAELRHVPRIDRPFWVMEQLELALFEGAWPRLRAGADRLKSWGRPRRQTHNRLSTGATPPSDLVKGPATYSESARSDLVQHLVTLRQLRGLSQQHLAARMGVSEPALSDLELGRTDPLVSTLERYARACGVSLRLSLRDDTVTVESAIWPDITLDRSARAVAYSDLTVQPALRTGEGFIWRGVDH